MSISALSIWDEYNQKSHLQVYASEAHEAHWGLVRRLHLRDNRSRAIKTVTASPDAVVDMPNKLK